MLTTKIGNRHYAVCLLTDDELPDYIMVMVANKKSESQMTDDLSLFLGNNTTKFTSWLVSIVLIVLHRAVKYNIDTDLTFDIPYLLH